MGGNILICSLTPNVEIVQHNYILHLRPDCSGPTQCFSVSESFTDLFYKYSYRHLTHLSVDVHTGFEEAYTGPEGHYWGVLYAYTVAQ